VPYREELEAALARTAAAEDDLAAARSESAHDHARIAELEKELGEARKSVTVAETRAPEPESPKAAPPPPPAHTLWRRLTENGKWVPLVPFAAVLLMFAPFLSGVIKGNVNRPKQIDVMAELSRAKADARKLMPDAALLQMETQSIVDSRGFADLTKGFVTFDFYSPSRKHYVHVVLMQGGARAVDDFTSGPGMRIHDPPHCSVVDVWAEAIRRGAPPSSLASIHLGIATDGLAPAWVFQIGTAGDKTFDMTISDECPKR
jgi:hypothetical protein